MGLSSPDILLNLHKCFDKMGLDLKLSDVLVKRLSSQKSIRTTTLIGENNLKLSISLIKNNYICCHFSVADISILSDYEIIKDQLDIVQRSFASLGRLNYELNKSVNIFVRDTSLLAPGGKKSLASIGSMYGDDFNKVVLPSVYRGDMLRLKEEDPNLFKDYAIQDSLITLKHINTMEDFMIDDNKVAVPLTLSSLSRNYILNY